MPYFFLMSLVITFCNFIFIFAALHTIYRFLVTKDPGDAEEDRILIASLGLALFFTMLLVPFSMYIDAQPSESTKNNFTQSQKDAYQALSADGEYDMIDFFATMNTR